MCYYFGMNLINFRQLQRLTVNQLKEQCPLTVSVDNKNTFTLLLNEQVSVVGSELTTQKITLVKTIPPTGLNKKRGEMKGDDYL